MALLPSMSCEYQILQTLLIMHLFFFSFMRHPCYSQHPSVEAHLLLFPVSFFVCEEIVQHSQ